MGLGVRKFASEPVKLRRNGGGFERCAVIAIQHRLGLTGSDALGKGCSLLDAGVMVGMIGFMHLPFNDLATVDIQNQVQIKPSYNNLSWQLGHIPAPEITGSVGDMGRRWALLFGLFRACSVSVLALRTQHSAKGRFTGQINSLFSQSRGDGSRSNSKAGLINYAQHPDALLKRERPRRRRTHRNRSSHARLKSAGVRSPSVQRSAVDPGHLTGFAQTSAAGVRNVDILGHGLAIFQSDHWS